MENNEIFKTTALFYFKDALENQEYESCPELISVARNLGAEQAEINELIASYLRGDKAQSTAGANRVKNHLKLIKEEK